MKRIIYCAMLLVAMVLVSACWSGQNGKVAVLESKTQLREGLTLAEVGKVKGVEFPLGTPVKEVLQKWGKPGKQGEFDGGFYYTYDNVILFSDGNDATNGKLNIISVTPGREIAGVKVGATPAEAKKLLGQPTYEGYAGDDDELSGGYWETRYNAGNYSLLFYSQDQESPTVSAQLGKRPAE